MSKAIRNYYRNLTLARKIRLSFFIIQLPLFLLLLYSIYNIWSSNYRYQEMIQSAVTASEFSLDFKKDYDDETYLLIAGNKSVEESDMSRLLADADHIVAELTALVPSETNAQRLKAAGKYLANLETYRRRIEENIELGDRYEENMQIWENDVQIVTTLVQETMSEYIYYEIRELEQTRAQYQLVFERMFTVSGIGLVFLISLMLALSVYVPKSISRPIAEMSKATMRVAQGDLTARSEISEGGEVGVLNDSLNIMIDKINELLAQVTTEQTRLRTAELELLQAQINPHFLYNTLDTIIWLAESSDLEMVVFMVKSLSDFFRTSLNQGREIVTLAEEVLHARSYLEIQQVRYRDILEYEIHVPEELNGVLVPKITIQPLVENALYHGIKNKRGMGKIIVEGRRVGDTCEILVRDNGKGMSQERLGRIRKSLLAPEENQGEIFGLSNVNERIQLKFGSAYGISIESQAEVGTEVLVRLPME